VVLTYRDGDRHVLDVDPVATAADGGYAAAFAAPLEGFLAAARGDGGEVVGADEALRLLGLVETCYARRERLQQPWVTATLPA
jgi:hypothetical protein